MKNFVWFIGYNWYGEFAALIAFSSEPTFEECRKFLKGQLEKDDVIKETLNLMNGEGVETESATFRIKRVEHGSFI